MSTGKKLTNVFLTLIIIPYFKTMLEFFLSFLLTIYSVYAISAPDTAEKVISTIDDLPSLTVTLSPFPTLPKQSEPNFGDNSDSNQVKTEGFNSKSEKPVGLVAEVAIEKSPVLVPCSENPDLCITTTPSPTPTPKPTQTSSPTLIPDPPKPLPTICPQKHLFCLDMACPLGNEITSDCGCPCIPPSAY